MDDEVKKEGYLKKKGDKGIVKLWKSRYFILKGNSLDYYVAKDQAHKGTIDLNILMSVEEENDVGFFLCVPGRVYYLSASTEEEKDEWVKTLIPYEKGRKLDSKSGVASFLAQLEDTNAQIDTIISKIERDESLTTLDLTSTEIIGKKDQRRFIESLKRNTHLTSLNISGTTWQKPGDFINSFTQNLSLTKLVTDNNNKKRALHPDVLRIIEHYLTLNTQLREALTGNEKVNISIRKRKLKILPSFLFKYQNCDNITSLDISMNRLSELPQDIYKLPSLTISFNFLNFLKIILTIVYLLDASNNRITNVESEIGQLTTLTQLNLNVNRLLSLPDSLGSLVNLQILKVEENSLIRLPHSLVNCTKLEDLGLYHNPLSSIPQEILTTISADPTKVQVVLDYLRNVGTGQK